MFNLFYFWVRSVSAFCDAIVFHTSRRWRGSNARQKCAACSQRTVGQRAFSRIWPPEPTLLVENWSHWRLFCRHCAWGPSWQSRKCLFQSTSQNVCSTFQVLNAKPLWYVSSWPDYTARCTYGMSWLLAATGPLCLRSIDRMAASVQPLQVKGRTYVHLDSLIGIMVHNLLPFTEPPPPTPSLSLSMLHLMSDLQAERM